MHLNYNRIIFVVCKKVHKKKRIKTDSLPREPARFEDHVRMHMERPRSGWRVRVLPTRDAYGVHPYARDYVGTMCGTVWTRQCTTCWIPREDHEQCAWQVEKGRRRWERRERGREEREKNWRKHRAEFNKLHLCISILYFNALFFFTCLTALVIKALSRDAYYFLKQAETDRSRRVY